MTPVVDVKYLSNHPIIKEIKSGEILIYPSGLSNRHGGKRAYSALIGDNNHTKGRLEELINISGIPSLPEAAKIAISKTLSINKSADDIAEIIKQSPSLALKILKLANSSYYSGGSKLTQIKEAVVLLGYKTVKSLVLSIAIKDIFNEKQSKWFHYKSYWLHSIATAFIAQEIAKTLSIKSEEEIYSAGLLHDIGKAVFLTSDAKNYKEAVSLVEKKNYSFIKAEREIFDFDHADVSAFLFRYWELPASLIKPVNNHHLSTEYLISKNDQSSFIIKIANELAHLSGFTSHPGEPPYKTSTLLIDRLGLEKEDLDRILSELKVYLETISDALNIPRTDIKGYFQVLASANEELGRMFISNQQMMGEITRKREECKGLHNLSNLFLGEKKIETATRDTVVFFIKQFRLDSMLMEAYLSGEKSILCTGFLPEMIKKKGKPVQTDEIELNDCIIGRGGVAYDRDSLIRPIYDGDKKEIGKIVIKNKNPIDEDELKPFIDQVALGLTNTRLHTLNRIKTEKLNIALQQLHDEYEKREQLSKLNELILDTSPIGIAIVDTGGTIIHANRESEHILDEALSGKNIASLKIFTDKKEGEKLTALIGKTGNAELTTVSDDRQTYLFVQSVPIENTGHTLILITDITERKENEKRQLQSEKMATLGELAAGIAHNLRSPLAVIKGIPELVLSEIEDGNLKPVRVAGKKETEDTQLSENMRLVQKSMEKTFAIIDSIMEFAKTETAQFEEVRISHVLDDVFLLLEHRLHGKDISFKNNTYNCIVFGNKNMLIQIFVNLCNNALDAVGNKGSIEAKCMRENGKVIIHFIDNGRGIQEEHLEKVFEPFFSTSGKANGTGLGLSVTRRMVILHGGSIKALQRKGGGTIFEIIFPDRSA